MRDVHQKVESNKADKKKNLEDIVQITSIGG